MKEKIKNLRETLIKFFYEYQSNPIQYFYESDIRAMLFVKLTNDNLFDIKLPITDNNQWLRNYKEIYKDIIIISGIKTEYPSNTRFDIGYIDPMINKNLGNHYILDCKFAIEIKLSQNDNKNAGFKSDIKKLQDYQKLHPNFTGIAINFEQNPLYKKEKLIHDYENYVKNINILDAEKIEIVENFINYFIIGKDFIIGGNLQAT